MSADLHEFSTGAVRSTDADDVRYDLISPVALDEIARTYAEGSAKYGDHNWLKGMPVSDLLNHALRHVYMFLSGDRSEPHLPHAAWGLMAAIHSYRMWPHLNGNLLGQGCTPPSEAAGAAAGPESPGGQCAAKSLGATTCLGCGGEPGGCSTPGICLEKIPARESEMEAMQSSPAPSHHIPTIEDALRGLGPFPVLYLSGPMSGIADYNFPAFNKAAEKLRQVGFPVLNPADFGADPALSWEECLQRDLAVMGFANVVVQLPGWEQSRGASLEYSTAIGLGKGVTSIYTLLPTWQ